MRMADILRAMVNMIDAAEQQSASVSPQQPTVVVVNNGPTPQQTAPAPLAPQPAAHDLSPVEVSNTDNSETGVFVPPLQAKLEILKKSVGLDNVYDELGDVKKLAGLKPAQQEAADDEPFEG